MFQTLQELLIKLKTWLADTIPANRLKLDSGGEHKRVWFLTSIDYKGKLTLEDLRKITNRKTLNDLYVTRYMEKDPKKRKGISAIKTEISALYGFSKCFTERYKGRMHFYRDDLSQKGARIMGTVGQSFGVFDEFKKQMDS